LYNKNTPGDFSGAPPSSSLPSALPRKQPPRPPPHPPRGGGAQYTLVPRILFRMSRLDRLHSKYALRTTSHVLPSPFASFSGLRAKARGRR
jgi:hypothetical protein